MNTSLSAVAFLAVCLTSAAQQSSTPQATPQAAPEPSLADRARAARKDKATTTPTKKTFTNETIETTGRSSSPFPEINTTRENLVQIAELMKKYRGEHTEKETEDAVRQWFTDQDNRLDRLRDQASDKAADQQRRNEAASLASTASAEQRRRLYASAQADNKTYYQMEQEARVLGDLIVRLRQGLRSYGFPLSWMSAEPPPRF